MGVSIFFSRHFKAKLYSLFHLKQLCTFKQVICIQQILYKQGKQSSILRVTFCNNLNPLLFWTHKINNTLHKKNQSIFQLARTREKNQFSYITWYHGKSIGIIKSHYKFLLHKVKLERRQTGDAKEYSLCLVQSRRKV